MLKLAVKDNGFMKGVFIQEARIINIKDLSGKPTYQENPDSIADLAIEVELDIGKDWRKKLIIKGDFKKLNNLILDWGGAFVVKDFFMKTGCFKNLTEEEISENLKLMEKREIPAQFLIMPINKKIYTVSYLKETNPEGKAKYATWNIVDTDPENLRNAFKNSVKKGYPANYRPDSINAIEENESVAVKDDFIF